MSHNGKCDSVLLVDDDPDFRALVTTIGEICGVPVIEAEDCSQALKVLALARPNIKMILLDYSMPGMEPSDCVNAIRTKAGSRIPIVLITAAANPAERAARLKLSRWVAKPTDITKLEALLVE